MNIIHDTCQNEKKYFAASVVTLGTFDGVHRGHQELLRQITSRAGKARLPAVLVTYHPHPVRVLRPAEAPPELTTLDEKLPLFELAGISDCIVMQFDQTLAHLTALDFIERILVRKLGAREVTVGYDHRFGHQRTGTIDLLRQAGERWGFQVTVVEPVADGSQPVKSSHIRQALQAGDMPTANLLLGHDFSLTGEIVPGHGVGKTMGYPTINLKLPPEKIVPRYGIYASRVDLDGQVHYGLLYIGNRPTFPGALLSVEVYVLDYHNQERPARVVVSPQVYLREDRKFPGPEALAAQMRKDEELVRSRFIPDTVKMTERR